MAERQEIIDHIIETGLVEKCVRFQTRGANEYLKEELTQELWLWLMEYDIDKLGDAYENNHLNALITRWISNQFHSRNSPFHKRYRKWQAMEDGIEKARNVPY